MKKFDGGNIDDFDEWLPICQSFSYKPLSVYIYMLRQACCNECKCVVMSIYIMHGKARMLLWV